VDFVVSVERKENVARSAVRAMKPHCRWQSTSM